MRFAMVLLFAAAVSACDGNDVDVRTSKKKREKAQLSLAGSAFTTACSSGRMSVGLSKALGMLYKQTKTSPTAEGCTVLRQRLAASKSIDLSKAGLTASDPVAHGLGFIQEFSQVESLELSGNQLTSFSELKGFKALKRLDLSGNAIKDLKPLAATGAELTDLLLAGNPLDLAQLQYLPKTLALLDLTGIGLDAVQRLPVLTVGSLLLDGNQLSTVAGLPVEFTPPGVLGLARTAVADLEPLRGKAGLNMVHAEGSKADAGHCPVSFCTFAPR